MTENISYLTKILIINKSRRFTSTSVEEKNRRWNGWIALLKYYILLGLEQSTIERQGKRCSRANLGDLLTKDTLAKSRGHGKKLGTREM